MILIPMVVHVVVILWEPRFLNMEPGNTMYPPVLTEDSYIRIVYNLYKDKLGIGQLFNMSKL